MPRARSKRVRKVTVLLPEELIRKATTASGVGITSTLRRGLELLVVESAYEQLRSMKGKLDLNLSLNESRQDRDV